MDGNLIVTAEYQRAFERSIALLDSSIREIRRVADNMLPETLRESGLQAALQELCSQADRSGKLRVVYHSAGLAETIYQPAFSISIYRIVQELIRNAVKHADATMVTIGIRANDDEAVITCQVEGNGFDSLVDDTESDSGWGNIRERVQSYNGKWSIDSAAGKGTSVFIELNI